MRHNTRQAPGTSGAAESRSNSIPSDGTVADIARLMCSNFYQVVDGEYHTYCALTSAVTQAALTHFGIESAILPCQLIHLADEGAHFIGFCGLTLTNQWDGHVVVCTRHLLLDWAVGSLSRYHSLRVPRTALVGRLAIRSNVIGRASLGNGRRLLWVNPPDGVDVSVPPSPAPLVRSLSERLIEKLYELGAGDGGSKTAGETNPAHLSA